jgi:hypothetical protein
MINHARTLLLNKKIDRITNTDIGYEYVPPNYREVQLPVALNTVRNMLFGTQPDNFFLNTRCRELLGYIHQTELSEHIYKFDPRVTYWPEDNKAYFDAVRKKVTVTQTAGAARKLTVSGELTPSVSVGSAYRSYLVSLGKVTPQSTALTLYVKKLEPPQSTTSVTYSLSNPPVVILPGLSLRLQISDSLLRTTYTPVATELDGGLVVERYDPAAADKIVTETPVNFNVAELADVVGQWYITTQAAPSPAITSAITAIEMLGEPVTIALFGLKNEEPYATFKNLWFDHPLPAYRLSGLVLALIYRTEELRAKNG